MKDSFFENRTSIKAYTEKCAEPDSAKNSLEEPHFLNLVGSVAGRIIWDLGCGQGGFGKHCVTNGCKSYHGYDKSEQMLSVARRMQISDRAQFTHCAVEEIDVPERSIDLITSRLVFQYLPDISDVFSSIYHALTELGRFVFSIEHPIITASNRSRPSGCGERFEWIVDDYFCEGRRDWPWLGGQVTKYHRPIDDYIRELRTSGFRIENLSECRPARDQFTDQSNFLRRRKVPMFLVISAVRT